MPRPERNLVSFLIRRHLEMSAVMNSRDLQDPATARHMAERVETVERLKALTLMTYADISAVNPAADGIQRRTVVVASKIIGPPKAGGPSCYSLADLSIAAARRLRGRRPRRCYWPKTGTVGEGGSNGFSQRSM